MSTAWLARARFQGGLLIPGRPWYAASLTLGPDHVTVNDRRSFAALAWGDQASTFEQGATDPPAWRLMEWTRGRPGPMGAAVQVAGRYVAESSGLCPGPRRHRLMHQSDNGRTVPLYIQYAKLRSRVDHDLGLVDALCWFLGPRPEARARLSEASRVAHLISDLLDDRPPRPTHYAGVLRLTTEVITALTALGYRHAWGRPFPGQRLVPIDQIVDQVMAHLADGRWSHEVHADRASVRAVVAREYSDVARWPFASLIA